MVEQLGFDIVDINLGCPAKKVVKCGGSGLLRDLKALEQLLRAVRAAVQIPLTIKIRAGWDENSIVAVEVARMAEQIGIEGIAVHPRTRAAGLYGTRRLEHHSRREAGRAHARDRQRRYQLARRRHAHVARNRMRRRDDRPRRFEQSLDFPPDRAVCAKPDLMTSRASWTVTSLLSAYFRNLVDTEWPDAIGRMKQFACYFTHGVRNGSELRRNVHTARTPGRNSGSSGFFFCPSL